MAITNNFYNSLIKKRIVMLHKNRSKNRNQLKFLLVLPAIAVFLMSFNTKEIYINKVAPNKTSNTVLDLNEFEPSNIEINTNITKPMASKIVINKESQVANKALKQDMVAYFIESTFTDTQLDEVIDKFNSHGITLKIKGVKRNNKNEITALKIDAKSKNSSANFSIDNDFAIKTIKITYNVKDDSISIGNTNHLIHDNAYEFVPEDGLFTINKSKKEDTIFVFRRDEKHDGDHHEAKQDEDKIIIKRGDKVLELKKASTNKNTFVFSEGGKKMLELKGNNSKDGKTLHEWKDKDGNIFIHSDGNRDEKIIIKSSKKTLWSDDKDGKVIIESSDNTLWHNDDNDTIAFQTIKKGESKIFISGDNNKALFIIDDKEVSKKEFDKLDTDHIESVNVLKGEAATKLYGDKGKNGVIVVTTKKKKD
jgi:TonB-dependent SusC/RagA subfamily outer membrane receptor